MTYLSVAKRSPLLKLLAGIPADQYLEEKSLDFYKIGEYDKSARCLIGCAICGHSADIEDYLFDLDESIDHWFGHPDLFTEDDLKYCETIVIPKLIKKWINKKNSSKKPEKCVTLANAC